MKDINMEHYFVNEKPQINGEHEVHKETCALLPPPMDRKYVGYFLTSKEAINKAKQYYS
ncbi:MAG: hypothetical protein ACYC2P_01785 [Paludibacteraceae bacterium]